MKNTLRNIPLHIISLVVLFILCATATGCSKSKPQPPSDLFGTYVHANGDSTNSLLKLNTDYSCEMIFEAGNSRTPTWNGTWEFDGSIIKVQAPRFGVSVSYERAGGNLRKMSSDNEEYIKR